MLIAYLMQRAAKEAKPGLSLQRCVELVRRRRWMIEPNRGFMRQLERLHPSSQGDKEAVQTPAENPAQEGPAPEAKSREVGEEQSATEDPAK